MEYCYQNGINLFIFSQIGKLKLKLISEFSLNIYLSEFQIKQHLNEEICLIYSKEFIKGKLLNELHLLTTEYRYNILENDSFNSIYLQLNEDLNEIDQASSIESLRGLEGNATKLYFKCFNYLILIQKEDFYFHKRSRRPPLDPLNKLLSFTYTLLTNLVESFLISVGLNSSIGFL